MKSIIFDVETTGLLKPMSAPLCDQPQIIEIGALCVRKNGRILKRLNQLIDLGPGILVPTRTTQITGITNKDLVGQPLFRDYASTLAKFFHGADNLIAHNAAFDKGMLEVELSRLACGCDYDYNHTRNSCFPWPDNIICTIQEYKSQFGKWPKLTELYKRIMGEDLAQTHRALDDCVALNKILVKDKFFAQL